MKLVNGDVRGEAAQMEADALGLTMRRRDLALSGE